MKMICRLWIAPLLLLPLGAAIANSQEGKAKEAAAKTDDPMMAKWMEFGTPGPAHRVLDAKVGKWNVKTKMTMTPGATPVESTCTSEVAWTLDGHYLQEKSSGEFMGQKTEMLGTIGYDNLKKKYVCSWISNCGTGICAAEGTYDAGKKTFTYTGHAPDVMAGKYVDAHTVEKWTDNDHVVFQSYVPGPDGKNFMSWEMSYTRANADKGASAK